MTLSALLALAAFVLGVLVSRVVTTLPGRILGVFGMIALFVGGSVVWLLGWFAYILVFGLSQAGEWPELFMEKFDPLFGRCIAAAATGSFKGDLG